MIRRPGNRDDGESETSQSGPRAHLPSAPENLPAMEECLRLPPKYHLTTKKIGDARHTITCTLIDAPGSPKNASLARTQPLLFTALDPSDTPIVTYALNSRKLSSRHRSIIGGLLDEVAAQHSRGDNTTTALQLLRAIFNRTRNIKDAWSTNRPNGNPIGLSSSTPPLMTPYIPPVLGYLKDPSKLGRVYQSRDPEAPKSPTVIIELDPGRNRARFILSGTSPIELKPIAITVPGPAQGSLSAEKAMRYLRVMSWNALEKLRDEGPEQFVRHLRQVRAEKKSVHIKNLPTGASLQVFAGLTETGLVIASRPFRAKGIEEPVPASCIFKFPGNTQKIHHPLHHLLSDLAMAVKTPESAQHLENVVGQLVDALHGCDGWSICTLAPALSGIFDPDSLKHLLNIPGISIEPVAPGNQENMPPLNHMTEPEPIFKAQLAHTIAEVAQGISRVQVRPVDSARWSSFPEAFHSLTLDVYPDRSVLIRARNACGASLKCFLSQASRFPAHFHRDLTALICKTFARQVEQRSVVEGRGLLLEVLTELVKMDAEHNFLSYRASSPAGPL